MKENKSVNKLFKILKEKVEPYYPKEKVVGIGEKFEGFTFFPGSSGLYENVKGSSRPAMPVGGVMVLGQDLYSKEEFEKAKVELSRTGKDETNSRTWTNLRPSLDEVGIPLHKCFFTNAYMGLRKEGKVTGQFPVLAKCDFEVRCQEFFIEQLRVMQPNLLLVLGVPAMRFLVHLSGDLEIAWLDENRKLKKLPISDEENKSLVGNTIFRGFNNPMTILPLTHPSYYKRWVTRRRYGELKGREAEIALLKKAWDLASIE